MTALHADASTAHPFTPKLTLKIPKSYWNAYQSLTSQKNRVSKPTQNKTPRLKLSLNAKPSTQTLEHHVPAPRPRPTNCRTKLWRFTYGGTKRAVKGEHRNDVAYEAPCLQSTCVSCCTWHARLMHDPVPLRDETPSISPNIDPRIPDGTWRFAQSRAASSSGEVATPVNESREGSEYPDVVRAAVEASRSRWSVSLPTSLLEQMVSTAEVRTRWRGSPRQRWMARVKFVSSGGKEKFRDLVKLRERGERGSIGLVRREGGKEERRDGGMEGWTGKRVGGDGRRADIGSDWCLRAEKGKRCLGGWSGGI